MESRFGPIGAGAKVLSLHGEVLTIEDLLFRMGLMFDDARPIDVITISEARFAVRYYDAQDHRIVAHEFDSDLHFLGEVRAHIAEWIGDSAYFALFSGH